MCPSLHEFYSRLVNKNRGDSFNHNKGIEEYAISEWCKIISNSSPDSSPCKKRSEMDNRRPSDEENLCPSEHCPPATHKKHAKLKYANSNEWETNKRAKLSEDSPSPKEARRKREKGVNGDKHLAESRRRVSPSTRHRRTGSFDGNCLKSSGNKRPIQNGEVTRTHSHSINSQNVTHTPDIRPHNGSCPSLRTISSPTPDLPPKHPSHLLKNSELRHKNNGLLPTRQPSPLPNGHSTPQDANVQTPDLAVVKTEAEASNQKVPETTRPLDVRRAVLSVKKRSVPTQPLIERIYSENRKRVDASHKPFPTETVQTSFEVLYRQPNESPKYFENRFSYKQTRPQLIKLLQSRILAQYKKEYLLCVEQDKLQEKWEIAVQECNESESKRTTQTKIKDQYERFYPELRRQREQERVAKITGSGETEVCEETSIERHESVAAVIPAMVLNSRERKSRFISKNGYIDDLGKFTEQIKSTNIWTEEEKNIFKEQFHQFPKNFEQIATTLKNKSVSDCIQYYYLNKRQINFKHSLKSANGKRRKNNRLQAKDSMYLYVKPRCTSLTSPDMQTPRQRRTPDPDWTPDDVEKLKNALLVYGRSWNKVQQAVGRSHNQCKMFFNDFCSIEEYGLQHAIDERSRLKAKERQERLVIDSEDPLPSIGRTFSDELSDTDSSLRQLSSSPPDTIAPRDHPLASSHLLEHSYARGTSNTSPTPTDTTQTHSSNNSTFITALSPALHARLVKSLRESCLGKSARLKKSRRSSASALLQPSNHRKLSAGPHSDKCTPNQPESKSDQGWVPQERSSSDTYIDQQALTRIGSFSSLSTSSPIDSKTPVLSSEVVTEPPPDPREKPDPPDWSDDDSDQEGGRLVIDVEAGDVIEETPGPGAHGGSFSSLPDLTTERVDPEPEVFQPDDTSPSELSPDAQTDLSPAGPPARFQDAWAYRDTPRDGDIPDHGQLSSQFDRYSDLEPRRVDTKEGDSLNEILSKLTLPQAEQTRSIPAKYTFNLPKEICQGLEKLKNPDTDHKRNVGAAPPKETHKRFKSDSSQLSNGTAIPVKEEGADPNKAESPALRLYQYRPELVQQPRLFSYPLYHHPLGPIFLQGQFLTPPQGPGKFIYPQGVPITLKQQEQMLLQNPMSPLPHSYPPSIVLQGSGLYPLPYPSPLSQEGALLQHDNSRGPTNKHLERP